MRVPHSIPSSAGRPTSGGCFGVIIPSPEVKCWAMSKKRRLIIVLALLHLLMAGAGAVSAFILSQRLPGISSPDLMQLPQMTILLDRNGERLHSFAEQRRTPITLEQISPIYIKALLATEDPRFFRHIGIDLKAISRAVFVNLTTFRSAQGGSTITQQLARDLFLSREKTLARKAQEAILALRIEQRYTKREILELYCNRIYFGQGRYGIEAASQFYFGKHARELSLPEAALLAGLSQRPEGYMPLKHPDRALSRRNHVLDRMVEEGLLDSASAKRAKGAPLGTVKASSRRAGAQYFVEEVRRFLLKQFGEEALYRSGLQVKTTLDPELQLAAERAVRAALDDYGRRHRIIPTGQPLPEGAEPFSYQDPDWLENLVPGEIVNALCDSVGLEYATLRIGTDSFSFSAKQVSWTGRKVMEGLFQRGKLYPVKLLKTSPGGRPIEVELASDPPLLQSAFMAVDIESGEVLALVGGRDYDRSEYDRATQAERQAGSSFKPFIYAAALEQGLSPSQLIWDVPTVLTEPGIPEPYQPDNYDNKFEGLVTLQHALDHSRNVPTVRLIDSIGYQPAIDIAQRLGIKSGLKPYPSLALGAFEVRLSDLISGYAAFANGGILVTPRLVRTVQTAEGEELWASKPETREVLSPEIATAMVSMLTGPTTRGTAADALKLGFHTIGKTGTTNDFSDAWFIGCSSNIAAGVWIGYDQRRSLGRGETGGKAALPVWMSFMETAARKYPAGDFHPSQTAPVSIDLTTGLRARPEAGCEKPVDLIFPPGKEPTRFCSAREHQRARLPYPLQRFPLRTDGALLIPPGEAAFVTGTAPRSFEIVGEGREIRFNWGEKTGTVALAWAAQDWQKYLAAKNLPDHSAPEGRPAYGSARGPDGWPAEVFEINRTGAQRPVVLPRDPP